MGGLISADMLLQIVILVIGQGLVSAAIYGGIRADLRHTMSAAEAAHRRIDAMLGAAAVERRNRGAAG